MNDIYKIRRFRTEDAEEVSSHSADVLPEYQGKKIGKLIIQTLEQDVLPK